MCQKMKIIIAMIMRASYALCDFPVISWQINFYTRQDERSLNPVNQLAQNSFLPLQV